MRNKKRVKKPVVEVQINCASMEELQETLLQVSNKLLLIRKQIILHLLRKKMLEAEQILKQACRSKNPVSENNAKRRHRHGHQESRK